MVRTERDNAQQQVQRSAAAQRQTEAVRLNSPIRSIPPLLSIATRLRGLPSMPPAFANAVRSAVPASFELPTPGSQQFPVLVPVILAAAVLTSPQAPDLAELADVLRRAMAAPSPVPVPETPTPPPGCRSPPRTRFLSPGRLLPSGRRALLPSRRRLRLRPLMPHWPPYWSGSRRSPKAVRTRLHTRSTSSFSANTARTSAPSGNPRSGISGPGSAAMHPICPASRTSYAPSSPAPLLSSRLLRVQPPPQPKPQQPTRYKARPKRRGIRPKKLIRRPSQRPSGWAGKKSTICRREKSTQDSSEACSGINLAPACRPFRTNNSTIRPSSRLSESDPLSMTEACA